ncbi:MAG: hypothetical protein NTY08_16235 [Proteobacteria bacterium]|nr:hypothetical protein [Pseudomonadota bacterium]
MALGLHHDLPTILREKSDNFTRPFVFKSCFDDEFISLSDVYQVLNNLPSKTLYHKNIRLYLGPGLAPRESVSHYLKPILDGEGIEEWSSRVFGSYPFGLIINNCQLFHDPLSRRIATLCDQIYRLVGFPPGGIQAALFIGNYGYTPFGVHRDRDERFIIHAHLGPGTKTMTLWDPKYFRKTTGSTASFFDPDSISASGTHSEFGPGDMYVLPADFYHIGHTNGLSVGLAIAFVGLSNRQLLSRALELIRYNFRFSINLESEWFPSEKKCLREITASLFKSENYLQSKNMDYKLSDAVIDYQMLLRSNHGFRGAPEEIRINESVPTIVQIKAPFRLYWIKNTRSLRIYARQRIYDLSLSEIRSLGEENLMFEILEHLNSGRPLETARACQIRSVYQLLSSLLQWQVLDPEVGLA